MIDRYFKIVDGCSLNDLVEGEAGSESGETYNYYLFLRAGGSGVIMREKSSEDEYRFYCFSEFIESIWDDRITHTYKRTSEFKRL